MFANLEAFKRLVQNARDNVKEFSRIGVNNAKTFEQVSRETLLMQQQQQLSLHRK
jgi:hypothetical protein